MYATSHAVSRSFLSIRKGLDAADQRKKGKSTGIRKKFDRKKVRDQPLGKG
jgi:hypothetical protein